MLNAWRTHGARGVGSNVAGSSGEHPSPARSAVDAEAVIPVSRGLSGSTVDWIVERVRGTEVAVIGHFDATLLAELNKNHGELRLHCADSSSAERAVAEMAESLRESISVLPLELTQSNNRASSTADTVVVLGWPEGYQPHEVMEYVVRTGKQASRLILVLTDLAAGHHRLDLAVLLEALRQTVAPEHLSVKGEELRFVGRISMPETDEWKRFESETWPEAVNPLIRTMQARHRLELDGLRSRIRKLQATTESVSFHVGKALVAVGRSPSTLWRLPARLWQIYRSVPPKRSRRKLPSQVSFPPLQIPTPNASGLPVVAAILDTFSEYCFRFEADLVLLTPGDWREQMDRAKPALLLVESAWIGNNRAWHRLIADNWKLSENPLQDLLSYCRSHRIPSVFWNKEDPPSYETFIDAAKGFDVVLTTDADCIPRYKTACGHDRVYAMPFAAQPKLHNPRREADWSRNRVAFAGSWASRRDRGETLSCLLDAALPFGLHIFDRNLSRKDLGSRAGALSFPDRYQPAIRGSLGYAEMLTAYRCYDVLLNANSVTDSPTMFSRRVFESLGCGTPVVSTESVGMRRLLGDHVRVARNSVEASSHLRALFDDEEARARESHLAYRHVHENHTYRHRMADIRQRAGLREHDGTTVAVSVAMVVRYHTRALQAIEDFARQSHPNKELLLILRGSSFDEDVIRQRARVSSDIHILNVGDHTTAGGCLNRGVEIAAGEYIATLDDDCIYGERYIADMMLAANFADADILGKGTYYVCTGGSGNLALRATRPEHQVTDFIIESTLTARRDVLSRYPFEDQSEESKSALIRRASKAGCRIYSADRFNHIVVETGTLGHRDSDQGADDDLSRLARPDELSRALV